MSQEVTYVKPDVCPVVPQASMKKSLIKSLTGLNIPFPERGKEVFFIVKYSGQERFFLLRYDSTNKAYNVRIGANRHDAEARDVDAKIECTSDFSKILLGEITHFKERVDTDIKRDMEIEAVNTAVKVFSSASGLRKRKDWHDEDKRTFALDTIKDDKWRLSLYNLTFEEVQKIAKSIAGS